MWYISFELLEISPVSSFLPSSFHHLSLILTPSLSPFWPEWWDFSGLNLCRSRNYVCLIHCRISQSVLHIVAHQPTFVELIYRWCERAFDCQVHEPRLISRHCLPNHSGGPAPCWVSSCLRQGSLVLPACGPSHVFQTTKGMCFPSDMDPLNNGKKNPPIQLISLYTQ